MKKSFFATAWFISAVILWIAAAIFRFALVGYGCMAALLAAAGALLILLGLMRRHHCRRAFTCLSVLTGLGIFCICLLEVPILAEAETDAAPNTDYLIVLGAGVNGTTPSLSMVDRLDAAEAYLRANPDTVAILTGGQGPGEDITEAQAMYSALTARGIDAARLILEEQATSTWENLSYSMALIPEENASVAICSSEYHLCRAKYMAQSLGIEATGVAADTSRLILKVNYFLREAFALAYLLVFGG